eukprot:TRINITY_DN6784_c0_g1_i1.p2 TRINITY_DN6784_c0_g1~~TRINITY_DN6784_c0_g1_i1.p2  ORF type:complete len:228 (-),score=22.48 TRINITY_DN6784_c0_g1_i1:1467-2150(-)
MASAEPEVDDLTDNEDPAWISWFCALEGNEFFCEVDDDYVQDDFNLVGLPELVEDFDLSIELILDLADAAVEKLTEQQQQRLEQSAEQLYGLIHARFIVTTAGLDAMNEKFQRAQFGTCPRVLCDGQAVLPLGRYDTFGEDAVKMYCPKCRDLYEPRSKRHRDLDGAYWGPTFAHLFLLCFPYYVPHPPRERYIPRIFGFEIATQEQVAEVEAVESARRQGHPQPGS